jgi:hypothetical protein
VCAGLITLLVIIYKGHSSSLVRARSQEVLEVVFAGALCYTSLTGEAHLSDRCHLWSQCLTGLTGHHRSYRWSTVSSSVQGERVLFGHHAYSPPSRRHQGPFTISCSPPPVPLAHATAAPMTRAHPWHCEDSLATPSTVLCPFPEFPAVHPLLHLVHTLHVFVEMPMKKFGTRSPYTPALVNKHSLA